MCCRLFHSTTSFVCPNQFGSFPKKGADSTQQQQQKTISVGILQDKMNKTVSYDSQKHIMTIQAGMKLREFTAEATRVGMSVQVGSLPAYAGLTVGGVLSTSAHGSGDQATSTICDTLISLTWVDQHGEIRKSPRNSKEAKLFCGGMGLIGLITELEVQLTPPTHTKLITRYLSKDDNLVEEVEKMLKVCVCGLCDREREGGRMSATQTGAFVAVLYSSSCSPGLLTTIHAGCVKASCWHGKQLAGLLHDQHTYTLARFAGSALCVPHCRSAPTSWCSGGLT